MWLWINLAIHCVTEILLKSLDKSSEEIIKKLTYEIRTTSVRGIISELAGATSDLTVRKQHLLTFEDTCLSAWTDISMESDLTTANLKIGKGLKLLEYFCIERATIGFCGRTLVHLVLLMNLRNSVRTETQKAVKLSNIPNRKFKIKGLVAEYETALSLDRRSFESLFKNTTDKLRCISACILHDEYDINRDKYHKEIVFASGEDNPMELGLNERNLVFDYFNLICFTLLEVVSKNIIIDLFCSWKVQYFRH